MTVVVTTINPANGSNNVALNKVLAVTFTLSGGATSLDATTLTTVNFPLRHTRSSQVIRTSITYDAAVDQGAGVYTQVVYVTPTTLLYKNSSYTLKVVGYDPANTFPTGNIKDSAGTNLSLISVSVFVTGDDIEVTDGQKTNTEQSYEGDIRLPSSLKLTQYANLQIVKATPQDHSWGFTGQTITLQFNAPIATGTITGAILINQYPFLDEEGWYSKALTGTSNAPVFKWNSGSYADMDATFFDEPTWTVTSTGAYVYLTTTDTVLGNTRFEIDILDTLEDTSGNNLLEDNKVIFTSYSYPSYITPRTIRAEVPSIFDSLNLDFVHELIWRKSIEAHRIVGYLMASFTSRGAAIRDFVKYGTLIDIINDLMLVNSLLAGQTKTLGDFTVAYHPSAGSVNKNAVIGKYEELYKRARRIINWTPQAGRVFIKGFNSLLDPPTFRTRLWKNPRLNNASTTRDNRDLPTANTVEDRDYKLPGIDDMWS